MATVLLDESAAQKELTSNTRNVASETACCPTGKTKVPGSRTQLACIRQPTWLLDIIPPTNTDTIIEMAQLHHCSFSYTRVKEINFYK